MNKIKHEIKINTSQEKNSSLLEDVQSFFLKEGIGRGSIISFKDKEFGYDRTQIKETPSLFQIKGEKPRIIWKKEIIEKPLLLLDEPHVTTNFAKGLEKDDAYIVTADFTLLHEDTVCCVEYSLGLFFDCLLGRKLIHNVIKTFIFGTK